MANSSSKEEVAVSIRDGEIKKACPPRRRSVLQRVPVPLRDNEKQKHIYDPVAVPLGPYHHLRLPEFHLVEQLKGEVLDMVCGDRDRALRLSLVSERLPEIRQFYGGADGYSDQELAEMMLRDTCFVLCYIKGDTFSVFLERIGFSGSVFMWHDLFKLENQIPLWLMRLLTPFAYGDSHDLELQLLEFLTVMIMCNMETKTTPKWGNDGENMPLHLLDAAHRMLLPFNGETTERSDQDLDSDSITSPKRTPQWFNNMFRSATDLKAKGIHLRPGPQSLKDISFSSFSTHGRLHLPVFHISAVSRVFLSNLVAYEMSSDGGIDLGIIRYVSLMKTLVQGAEDVELLRVKGILYSWLPNEEVVRLFKDIDTCGATNQTRFNNVKMRIEEHCNNKGKTWLAELINTYFRSPLTAVALFAAAYILVLTSLQTFYTINPRYANAAPTTP